MGSKRSKKTKQSSRQATTRKRVPQVAALPWRRRKGAVEFLLVTSRSTGRWVVPKGGVMPHLIDMNAARQEAYEEAGITGQMKRACVGRYSYRKADGARQLCSVKVFALKVTKELKTWPEVRQRKRRWFAADDAIKNVGERNLKRIVRSFQMALERGPPTGPSSHT